MVDKLEKAFENSTIEMIGTYGGKASLKGSPIEDINQGFKADTTFIISVVGDLNGSFALRCPQSLAAKLASNMLEMDVEIGSEDMKDAVGELFNMIIGTMKRLLSDGKDAFKLSVPMTIIGEDYKIYAKASETKKFFRLIFDCEGSELAVETYLYD